jgi:hypothetical protein
VTSTPQRADRSAPLRALLALFVLVFAALSAATAAAATSPADPTSSGSTVLASPDPSGSPASATPTASAASVPAPETTAAGPAGGAPAVAGPSAGPSPILISDGAPPLAADVRAQPTVLAAGSGDSPVGPTTTGTSGSRSIQDQPIVSTTTRRLSPIFKPTVTQLASGGPFVAASGSSADPAPATPPVVRSGASRRPITGPGPMLPLSIAPPAGAAPAAAAVSVPLVDVYIGGATSARHPGQKPTPSAAEPVGPAGLPATTISPFGVNPPQMPGGMTPLFGNAPFSSTGAGIAPLVPLSAMLAAMTLVAGLAGRRRSWDLPVLLGESALLSSALDRPG